MKHFDNAANSNAVERNGGDTSSTDTLLKLELEYAGVPLLAGSASILARLCDREVKTVVLGELHNWGFVRKRHYWEVTGPGLDFETAMDLWKVHGKYVRANGDAGCRSPWLWNKGFATTSYHVDTWQGLKVLADIIKNVYTSSEAMAAGYNVLGGE